MSRSRAYCFTSYKDHDIFLEEISTEQDSKEEDGFDVQRSDGSTSRRVPRPPIDYICWGREVCPETSRRHLQGYVEFRAGLSLNRAKSVLRDATLHLERRRGSSDEAVEYCRKECTDQLGFTELGKRKSPGKRTDLDAVRALIKKGDGLRTIIESGVSYQGIRYSEKVLDYFEPGRSEAPRVLWYWGPTGTGKTRAVEEEIASLGGDDWWSSGGVRWFCGYDRHRIAVFDDFRPEWCKLSLILRLLDRYKMRVEYKGGHRQWIPEVIYITCPLPPQECYLDCGEDVKQLVRRIHVIKEFSVLV